MLKMLLVFGLACSPVFAFAAPYYEFAPDYSEPLTVNVGTTVSQKFAPLNDRLVSIDLWVGTGGQSASINAVLRNASGAAVSSRTVPLGAVADVAGGTRRTITLNSQIAVSGGEPYTLDITPSEAAVKLYRSTSISIAPGSGSESSSGYRYGVAIVNGEEQGYSFKFALTEAAETSAPTLADVQVSQPAIGQTFISLTASEPIDLQIVYGSRTVVWTGQYTPCLAGISRCSAYLPVTPGVTYPYSIIAKDAWGNTSTFQGTFTAIGRGPAESLATSTAAPSVAVVSPSPSPSSSVPIATPGDSTPPVITNPRLVSLTPTAATFAWTTDEIATSWLVIQVRPELRTWSYSLDNTFELEHYMSATGLPPDQYLRARITSTDPSGNYTIVNIDFVTPKEGDSGTGGATLSGSPTPSYTVVYPPRSEPPPPTMPSPTPSLSPTNALGVSPTSAPTAGSSSGTPAFSPTPSVIAHPSTSTRPGEITWSPAHGDYDGYRIDIFDELGNLITTLIASKDVTSLELPAGIPKGARVIVYADRDGAYEKVGITSVTDRPTEPASSSYTTSIVVIAGAVVLLALLLGLLIRERRKQKITVSAQTSIGLGTGPRVG